MLEEKVERSGITKGRSGVYHLLASAYLKEATTEFLAILKSEAVADALQELGIDLGRALPDTPQHILLNDLAEEYAALFIVPGGIPPYESVRLHGMLNQKPSWEVEEFYRSCGLVIKDECRILPDHLGMELEFMAYLAEKEGGARRRGDEKESSKWSGFQEEFFRGHLDPWAFDFLRDLQRLAFHPFYKGAGSLIVHFLETEKEYFGSLNASAANGLPQDEINDVSLLRGGQP